MNDELKTKLDDLVSRPVPYDTVCMRVWILEAKELMNTISEKLDDGKLQVNP